MSTKKTETPPAPAQGWSVEPVLWPNKHSAGRVQVTLRYGGRVVVKAHGRTQWIACKEMAAHFARTGYVPKRIKKCLADWPTQAARDEVARYSQNSKGSGTQPKWK